MLEYDPESHSKASHREWLSEKAVFKEVVPIADPTIRCAACQTQRPQRAVLAVCQLHGKEIELRAVCLVPSYHTIISSSLRLTGPRCTSAQHAIVERVRAATWSLRSGFKAPGQKPACSGRVMMHP